LLLILLSRAAWGGDLVPRLVRDLQPVSYAGSSSPRQFAEVSDGFVFTAFGNELWQYDRQEDVFSSVLRKDGMRQLSGAFYAALEPSGKWTLWTVAGFHFSFLRRVRGTPLRSVGPAYSDPTQWVPMLFDADDGSGRGLWVTDLFTEAGTFEIAKLLPFADDRLLRDPTPFGRRLYFVARDRRLGTALWVTDGTRAGTRPVFVPPSQQGTPLSIVGVVHGRLLLAVPGSGAELWTSDGTRRGTRPLQEIVRGAGSATIVRSVVAGQRAYLIVDDGRHGRELWATDGSPTGAQRLTDLGPADPFGAAELRMTIGSRLAFFADDGVHGREPWASDGTPQGTHRLADLCHGPCSSDGAALASLLHLDTGHHQWLFSAVTPELGRELWQTDGTTAGTSLVSDLCAGPCSSDPGDVQTVNGNSPATFTAVVAAGERALWTTDGTPEATVRLTPPGIEVAHGNRLSYAFAAADPEFGDELWTTEGTPETTRMWADIGRERENGSYPILLGAAGDRLLFTTYFPPPSRRLWASDGTADGTIPLPNRGPRLLEGLKAASTGSRMFLAGDLRGAGGQRALWVLDGTPAGAVRLTPSNVTVDYFLYALGDRAVFLAADPGHGKELWVSEGTPETTHLLIDLVPGPDEPSLGLPDKTPLLFGRLVFATADKLWLTDGTVEGTRPLLDVYPFLHRLEEQGFLIGPTEFRGKTYFVLSGEERQILVTDGTAAGTEVWDFPGAPHGVLALYPGESKMFLRVVSEPDVSPTSFTYQVTDGTPEGTVPIPVELGPGALDAEPIVFHDRLLFSSGNGEYWGTDGTPDGTFALQDPAGHTISASLGRATVFAGHLVFAAGNGFGICYEWSGNGPVAAPIPGAPLCGNAFVAAGSHLFFNGFEPHTGAELWVLEER
jgi:ELWxxDGT repeat protein